MSRLYNGLATKMSGQVLNCPLTEEAVGHLEILGSRLLLAV